MQNQRLPLICGKNQMSLSWLFLVVCGYLNHEWLVIPGKTHKAKLEIKHKYSSISNVGRGLILSGADDAERMGRVQECRECCHFEIDIARRAS